MPAKEIDSVVFELPLTPTSVCKLSVLPLQVTAPVDLQAPAPFELPLGLLFGLLLGLLSLVVLLLSFLLLGRPRHQEVLRRKRPRVLRDSGDGQDPALCCRWLRLRAAAPGRWWEHTKLPTRTPYCKAHMTYCEDHAWRNFDKEVTCPKCGKLGHGVEEEE